MPDRPDPTTLPVAAFAAVVALPEAEVRDLIRRGVLPKANRGRLPLIEAVRAVIAHTKADVQNSSLAAAQEQAKGARADASELALAIDRRDLVADHEVEASVDHVAATVVRALASIPARVTRDVPDRRRVEEALRAVQGAIADDLARIAGEARP